MSPLAVQKIAVIGSGIAGLSAAWRLSQTHDVTLYEAAPRLGGHANTVSTRIGGTDVDVDTGFIVFNPPNYPNFTPMLAHLGVASAPSDMSFSASLDGGAFEYSSNPNGLFAQKRNFVRPRMWRMLSDLLRLHEQARRLDPETEVRSLDEFLRAEGYSASFREDHILPMCAAIWSSPVEQMRAYPARAFFRFFVNHGLLQLTNRPLWRTVQGGSQTYVKALADQIRGEIRTGTPIRKIRRDDSGATVFTDQDETRFDQVVLACHSDQALGLLEDADGLETSLLGAIRYRPNTAVLHTDTRLMPRRRKAWAAWNYLEARREADKTARISLTYWMNVLQPLPTTTPVLVTLNPEVEPDPALVLKTDHYDHPVFDAAAVQAQQEFGALQGHRNTWYAGAWLGSGFHEDGIQSGLAVAEALGAPERPWGRDGATGRIPWCDEAAAPLVNSLRVAAE
ncbi:MAG: FAD-dependent oxidoreductase [Alphaproteobacteria bacterium]|uniref:NAD(P)/FAD-dependent oxidoreductase n=1 Tax=Maricaulis alexandrii TaxID=2570354 RepID=UPI001109B0CE|nr:FAD-dependent oxidoreductase [Maricaulis alexandrii]MCR9267681.1 FAD-dependent oxidoreductase [Alphaproteobacteria bacterium]